MGNFPTLVVKGHGETIKTGGRVFGLERSRRDVFLRLEGSHFVLTVTVPVTEVYSTWAIGNRFQLVPLTPSTERPEDI